MSRKSSSSGLHHHLDSFQEISFELNTNKKEHPNKHFFINQKSSQFSEQKKLSQQKMPSLSSLKKNLLDTYADTQRKAQQYNIKGNDRLLMDQATTPLKYDYNINPNPNNNKTSTLNKRERQSVNYNDNKKQFNNDPVNTKYREILIKLDETEGKLVISQKKYGQLWRKYEIKCQEVSKLNRRIQNDKSTQALGYRQQLRELGKKMIEKQEDIQQRDLLIDRLKVEVEELQLMIKKVEEKQIVEKEMNRKSFERIVNGLKKQVESLSKELLQCRRINTDLGQIGEVKGTNNTGSLAQQQQSLQSSNIVVRKLQEQLSTAHRQKLSLIESYEQQITSLTANNHKQIHQLNQLMSLKIQEEMNKCLQYKLQHEQLLITNKKLQSKCDNLEKELALKSKQIQGLKQVIARFEQQWVQVVNMKEQQQRSAYLRQLQQQQKQSQHQNQLHQLYQQLQQIKAALLYNSNQLIQKDILIQTLQQHNNQLQSQIQIKQAAIKQQQQAHQQQTSNLKNTITSIVEKVSHLQQQKQTIQKELFAERLENYKLREQIQDVEKNLKLQYQLSLNNLKQQLRLQIKNNTSKDMTINQEQYKKQLKQKQLLYIQLKQLQKKYQLLQSEMLTVDDMMSIATKVHKRHSKFVKNVSK